MIPSRACIHNQTPLTNRVTVLDTMASDTESYEINLPATLDCSCPVLDKLDKYRESRT